MKKHFILFYLCLFGLLPPHLANCQTDSWIIRDPNLLQEFLANKFDKVKTDDAWLNGKAQVDSFPQNYTPASNEYFALYQALFRRYFFQVQNANEQAKAIQQLRDLVAKPEFDLYRQYIFCEPVSLAVGKTVFYTDDIQTRGLINLEDAARNNQALKNLVLLAQELPENPSQLNIENFDQTLAKLEDEIIKSGIPDSVFAKYESLKKQYSENAKEWKQEWKENEKNSGDSFGVENGSSNGTGKKKGWFPVEVSFSQWMGTLVEFLITYYLPPGTLEFAQKALTLAYMIAPDLINNIASSLAKIQQQVTPDGFDNVLNHLAEVADYGLQIYNNLKSLQSLVNNPQFGELLKNFDLKKITQFAESKIDNKYLHLFNEYFPSGVSVNSLQNITAEAFVPKFQNYIKDVAKQKSKEYAQKFIASKNIPVLKNVDLNATWDLLEGKINSKEYAKQQGKRIMCGYTKSYSGACDSIFSGKYKGAIISATSAGLAKASHNKIKQSEIESFIGASLKKEYKEMWNISSGVAAENFAPKIGLSAEGIKTMNLALQEGKYKDFIKGATETVSPKYKFFGKHQEQINTLTDLQWTKMNEDDAKKLADVFLENTMGDKKIVKKVLSDSFDFMLDLGKRTDSLNGFQISKYLKSLNFNQSAIDNFLAGNSNEEINNALDKMIKGMGIIKPDAIQKLKENGFIAGYDEQRNITEKKLSSYSMSDTLKIEKQKWESLWHHELTRKLIYRKLALAQINQLNTLNSIK